MTNDTATARKVAGSVGAVSKRYADRARQRRGADAEPERHDGDGREPPIHEQLRAPKRRSRSS